METVGIKEEHVDKLKENEIDGSMLTGLTEEDLMSGGLPLGPARKLVTAVALLWKNITIHGVVLAPASETDSESCTEDGSSILTLRGMHAHHYLGGLDQMFHHMM